MSYRSSEPFFHDPTVHQAISDLAAADRITLYVGAGATIDRTGHGWAALIGELLADESLAKDHIKPEEAKLMSRVLEPVEAGSLAAHFFEARFGDSAETRLDQALERALYSGTAWHAGLLCTNIIRLALGLKQVGKDVHILTTNYDTFLEQEYLEQAKLVPEDADDFPDLAVFVLQEQVTTHQPSTSQIGQIRLTYLHGRIQEGGKRHGRLAVTELDYFALREPVLQTLSEAFGDSPVLILGSSLTDPPLLAALQETSPTPNPYPRFALTPVMSYEVFTDLTNDEVEIAKSNLTARMDEFRVLLLFPDFFYQVPQFCQEIAVAIQAGPSTTYDDNSSLRYGSRLQDWWSEWERNHNKAKDVEECYIRLTHLLARVRARDDLCPVKKNVKNSREEQFKIEVWMRWDPSLTSRRIGLWAVSTGIRRDFDSIRKPDLDAASGYEAVKAFVGGSPRLRALDTTADRELWRTSLSVPIYHRHEGVVIPVGVISLLGSKPLEESRIAVANVKRMSVLVSVMRTQGEALAEPQSPVVK